MYLSGQHLACHATRYSSKTFGKDLNEKQRSHHLKKKKIKHLHLEISAVYIVYAVYAFTTSISDCLHRKLTVKRKILTISQTQCIMLLINAYAITQ